MGVPHGQGRRCRIDCSQQPKCKVRLTLFQVRNQNARMEAYQQQKERCVARHFQVCQVLKQFDHLFNISSQLYKVLRELKLDFWEQWTT